MDNSLKDKVLDAVDIVAVIGERVALKLKGRDYVGLCPFHPDHKPSLSVSPRKQIFKCWSCGAGGDVIRFVQLRDRVEFREALATLARRAGIELHSSPAQRQSAQLREQIQAAVVWARNHFQHNLTLPAGRAAREYAQRRGLTQETIDRHGLGLALEAWDDVLSAGARTGLRPELLEQGGLIVRNENGKVYDRFRHRLIFPINDGLARPVAFGGRALGDDPAKYLNSPETVLFSKSRLLYALDLARPAIEERDTAIVVEGYMDAVLLHQYGFRNVVATLGTALSDAHVKLLRPLAGKLCLCFDGDEAGIRAADRGVEVALRTQADVSVVILEGDKDPADCVVSSGAEGFERQLKRAVDALEFKWSQTLRAFGQGSRQARRTAIEAFLEFVARCTLAGGVDPLQQTLLADRLSALLGVPTETVFGLLARAKLSVRRAPRSDDGKPDGISAYEAEVHGLPAGLTTAMETLLGLLLTDAQTWRFVDDNLAAASSYSETWRRLYAVLLAVREEHGDYSIGQVVAQCDDGALCELVSRARSRVAVAAESTAAFAGARDNLVLEMNTLRMGDLRESQRRSGSDDEALFKSLDDLSKARPAFLPAERGWSPTAT